MSDRLADAPPARRWLRRRAPCVIEVDDQPWIDLGALFAGELRPLAAPAARVRALLEDAEHAVTPAQVAVLAACAHGAWTRQSGGMADDAVERLLALGLLEACVAEHAPAPPAAPTSAWHPAAAHYHCASRWRGVLARDDLPGDAAAAAGIFARSAAGFAQQAGDAPAPEAFAQRGDPARAVPLPRPAAGALDEVLARRETHRLYDPARSLSCADLGAVLQRSLAAQAAAQMGGGLVALRKAVPSGGGLHPVEAYPLVARVDGLAPGWYHYRSGDHALAPLAPLAADQVRQLVVALTAGQAYYRDAPVVVFLALRFARHHWKYPRHAKAYRVMLLDAGHVGQAFALAAAERGLGAFFTAAINEADVDAALGLDGVTEGAIAAMGCGHAVAGGEVLRLSHYAAALGERPARG